MDDYSTDSDSAGEQETKPGSPQGTSRLSHSGQGLQGRKLQLGYGGGVQGAGVSFRTPEQEAAEDARRMRLFRGMQATVVLSVLSAALMITVAIVEANAASGCSVEGAVTRTEHFELTVDTMIGLQLLSVRCKPVGLPRMPGQALLSAAACCTWWCIHADIALWSPSAARRRLLPAASPCCATRRRRGDLS